MFTDFGNFLKITAKEISEDRVNEGAAALAYYITLATFPALITVIALVPYFPIEGLEATLIQMINNNLPGNTGRILSEILKEVIDLNKPALFSTGFIAAIWATSSGMGSIINQLNVAYDIKEDRGIVKNRIAAIILTFGYMVTVVLATMLIIKSRGLSSALDELSDSSFFINYMVSAVRYFIAYLVLLAGFASLYYFAPNSKLPFRFITPGSLFGSTVLILAAVGFDYYISNFANYDKTYGSIGGIVVYMVWLYIGSFVLLVGAEINGVYERQSSE